MTLPATAAKKPAAKKTTAAKKATSARTPRKTAAKKVTTPVSLTKPRPALPARHRDFMSDPQSYATLACRMVGIDTPRIRDWRDHGNNTATRTLRDGSTLHYDLNTRTLTWQAVCPMGAIHTYRLDSPSTAAAARVHADRCTTLHADLTKVPRLTADELEELGLLRIPTWAGRISDEPVTETLPVALPDPAPIAQALVDTQALSRNDIDAALTAGAEQAKEHPQP